MSHVPPYRWADLMTGKLPADEAAELEAHAAACERCRGERGRVERGSGTMRALAQLDPPHPPPDVTARVHWTISTELKRREREAEVARPRTWSPLRWSLAAFGLAGVGVLSFLVVDRGLERRPPPPATAAAVAPAVAPEVTPPPVVPAPAASLAGVVTLAEGQALLDGAPLSAEAVLRAGSRLSTGDGRVHVQFGDDSAFSLEPRSVLEIAAFDERAVELRVTGAIGVRLAHRAPEQTFAVVAAGRRVEVRGTVFRVAGGDDGLEVAVTRGRVAVVDGREAVEVPAGSWLRVPLAVKLAGQAPRPMVDAELAAAGERLKVTTLAVWSDAATARRSSALLRVRAPGGAPVVVDGVPVGRGELTVRVAPGRHLVGEGPRAQWVELGPGASVEAEAPLPAPVASKVVSERARQVEAEVARHRARFEVCAGRVHGQDPGYRAELTVEIQVDADGSVRSVVPLHGLPDPALEECLLGVIREQFTFPAGSRDTVRKSLKL